MPTTRLSTISLHPRVAAGLDVVVSLIMIYFFGRVGSLPLLGVWFAARVAWYWLILAGMYYPTFLTRLEHFQALVIFNVGVVFLLLFVDEQQIRTILELVLIFFSAASFWLVPTRSDDLSFITKPYRRWKFLMSVFGVVGIWNGVKALDTFQVTGSSLTFSLAALAIALTLLISIWGWQEYGLMYSRKFLIATLVMVVCLVEAAYVLFLWPLGYFVSSFILTWVWYLLWLLLRFYISDEGVNMKRQRWFLLLNMVMLLVFLVFIVRWR